MTNTTTKRITLGQMVTITNGGYISNLDNARGMVVGISMMCGITQYKVRLDTPVTFDGETITEYETEAMWITERTVFQIFSDAAQAVQPGDVKTANRLLAQITRESDRKLLTNDEARTLRREVVRHGTALNFKLNFSK